MLVGDRAGIQLLFLSNFTPWRAQGAQLFLKKTTTKPLHPRSIPSRTTLQPLEKRSIHRWHQQGGAVSGINHCAPSPPPRSIPARHCLQIGCSSSLSPATAKTCSEYLDGKYAPRTTSEQGRCCSCWNPPQRVPGGDKGGL